MKYTNACRIVAGSSLVSALKLRYGPEWKDLEWARTMLAGFAGALEGTDNPDSVLDAMEVEASRIRNGQPVTA